jgi:hypothetical protein
MLVACHGSKQPWIGVAVKAEAFDELRAIRLRASSLGAAHVPRSRTGTARAPVAIAKGSRVEKKRILNVIETSG